MRRSVRWYLAAAVLCSAGSASVARAQTDDERAAARVAARQGFAAFNEGRYRDALDLLERAESVVHAPTHMLFIARSYEKMGRLVKAGETYAKLLQEQLLPNASKPFRDAKTD